MLPRPLVLAALFAVWFFWGSTYFAIRVAIETIPPLRMAALRLVTAGLVLIVLSRARGQRLPTRAEALACAAIGALMFVGGNGSVVWAEQTVSSGLVAILVGAVPVYAAAIGAFYGRAPTRRQWLGIVLGVTGIGVLNSGAELRGNLLTVGMLAGGSIAWALASVQARRWPQPPGAMASGFQMLAGGVAMGVLSLSLGEHASGPVSRESVAALAWLITFGSLVAFSAYGYLLRNTSLPVATSYAYVNPVVAVMLGTWFGGEHLGGAGKLGLAVILAGVALVAWPERKVERAEFSRRST